MKIKLGEIYEMLASYKGLPYPGSLHKLPGAIIKQWENRADIVFGSKDVRTIDGKPIIAPVTIGGISLGSVKDTDIHLQPMMAVEGSKNIISTPITGGTYTGTVKEFISMNDYKVRIWGALVDKRKYGSNDSKSSLNQKPKDESSRSYREATSRDYPKKQMEILKGLWKKHQAVEFKCTVTDGLFDHVVIQSIKFDELKSAPWIQFYEIQASSDGMLEIEMLKE